MLLARPSERARSAAQITRQTVSDTRAFGPIGRDMFVRSGRAAPVYRLLGKKRLCTVARERVPPLSEQISPDVRTPPELRSILSTGGDVTYSGRAVPAGVIAALLLLADTPVRAQETRSALAAGTWSIGTSAEFDLRNDTLGKVDVGAGFDANVERRVSHVGKRDVLGIRVPGGTRSLGLEQQRTVFGQAAGRRRSPPVLHSGRVLRKRRLRRVLPRGRRRALGGSRGRRVRDGRGALVPDRWWNETRRVRRHRPQPKARHATSLVPARVSGARDGYKAAHRSQRGIPGARPVTESATRRRSCQRPRREW
jgi:hypothetical protein